MAAEAKTVSEHLSGLNYGAGRPFHELLDVFSYSREDQLFYTQDGRLGRMWRLPPIVGETLSAEDKLGIATGCSRIIDKAPDGSHLQFFRFTSADISGVLNRFAELPTEKVSAEGRSAGTDIALSVVSRQERGATRGFFELVSDDMLDAAREQLSEEMAEESLENEALVDLEAKAHSGEYAHGTECYLTFVYEPSWMRQDMMLSFREFLAAAFSKQGATKVYEKEYRREVAEFHRHCENIQDAMQTYGFRPQIVSGQGLINLLFRELNPQRSLLTDPPRWRPDMSIRELVQRGADRAVSNIGRASAMTMIETANTGWKIGDYHYRATSVKQMPEETRPGMVQEALDQTEGEGWVCINCYVPKQGRVRAAAKMRKTMVESRKNMDVIPALRADPALLAKQEEDITNVLNALNPEEAYTQKALDVSLHVVVRDLDAERAELRAKRLETLLWEQGYYETLRGDAIIHYALPFNNRRAAAALLRRHFRVLSTNLADLMPVYSGFQGVADGRLLFNNGQGSPVLVDPFTASTTAGHGLIVGGTGSGKSFLTNSLVLQMYAQYGAKIVIIDKGASYVGTVSSLGGQFITLVPEPTEEHEPLGLNVFWLPPEAEGEPPTLPTARDVEFMSAAVEAMMKAGTRDEAGKPEPVSKTDRTLVQDAIQHMFAERKAGQELVLSNLVATLKADFGEHPDYEPGSAQRLATRLKQFTEDGIYGQMFDRPLEVDWESDIICVETGLMADSPAMEVVMLVLFAQIETYFKHRLPRDQKKLVVIDEAWKVLEAGGGHLVSAISGWYRELRKYQAGCYLISQDLNSFVNLSKMDGASDEGVLANTRHLYLLGAQARDLKLAEEALGFTEEEIEVWRQAASVPPFFSEFFYGLRLTNNQLYSGKLRLYAAPVVLWMSTTQPDDVQLREGRTREIRERDDVPEEEARRRAIWELATEHPFGSQYGKRSST